MKKDDVPNWYQHLKQNHPEYIETLERLGHTVSSAGPLDKKYAQLIQLAAAAAIRSEGAVHSHVRRSLAEGATEEEIFHALILLTSTIGFPNVSAAINWATDITGK